MQVEIAEKPTYTKDNLSSLGTGNIYGNPMFVKPEWGTEGDFYLKSDSTAIDAGCSIDSISMDLE